jgi:hypothetical protein
MLFSINLGTDGAFVFSVIQKPFSLGLGLYALVLFNSGNHVAVRGEPCGPPNKFGRSFQVTGRLESPATIASTRLRSSSIMASVAAFGAETGLRTFRFRNKPTEM